MNPYPDLAEPVRAGDLAAADATCKVAPWEFDERIAWAFRCGIREYLKGSEANALVRALSSKAATVPFARGFVGGFCTGVRQTIAENMRWTVELLKSAFAGAKEFYGTVYDPVLLAKMLAAYTAGSSSQVRAKALTDIADYFSKTHPAAAGAVSYLALVEPALDELSRWVQDRSVVANLAVVIGHSTGELFGEEIGRLVSLASNPEQLGNEFGNIAGQGFAQLALLLLGF